MPNRIVLPALSVLLAMVGLAHPAASAGMKPVASVALPCDSYFQVISPAGDQVALQCSDHTLRLVNVRSGTTQHTFDPKMRIAQYNYSRDGHWFAVGLRDGTVEVVPTSGTAEGKRWKSDTRAIDTLEFLPDSSGIVVGPRDRPGQIWDLHASPKQLSTLHSDFAGLLACSFSPDGKLLVTADGDTVVRFYDTATWQMVHEYRGVALESFAVAFTADGKKTLLGGPDDHITVLDSGTGAELQKLTKDPEVIQQIFPFGSEGQAAILYVDGDGQKPPHQSIWNGTTAKSVPLTAERPLTGGGVVRGKLWVSSPQEKVLDIWVYE
jgi:hypothetical protein